MDTYLMIFTAAIAFSSLLTIYLIAKRIDLRKKDVQEAKQVVKEETGQTIPDDEIKRIVEKKTQETAEKKLTQMRVEQKTKHLKKAKSGMHKMKKKLFIVYHNKGNLSGDFEELGKAHSYDRFGLDGRDDYIVIYFFPKHNSVFLRGLQAIISKIGRGKNKVQIPVSCLQSGERAILVYADHIRAISSESYEVLPPEEIRVEIDLYNAYRDRYETLLQITNQLLDDLNKPFKKTLAFRSSGGFMSPERYMPGMGMGMGGDEDFYPYETDESGTEQVKNVWDRIKARKQGMTSEP